MKTGNISVDYKDSGESVEYESVISRVNDTAGKSSSRVFKTGDFTSDFINACAWTVLEDCAGSTMLSSSVDDFLADSNDFSWKNSRFWGHYPVRNSVANDPWHKVSLAAGKYSGSHMWIQNAGSLVIREEDGFFSILSVEGRVGEVFTTIEEAMAKASILKRKVTISYE